MCGITIREGLTDESKIVEYINGMIFNAIANIRDEN